MANAGIRLAMASLALLAFTGCAGEEGVEATDSEDTAATEQASLAGVYMAVEQLTARKNELDAELDALKKSADRSIDRGFRYVP